jgi:hypothetical protein
MATVEPVRRQVAPSSKRKATDLWFACKWLRAPDLNQHGPGGTPLRNSSLMLSREAYYRSCGLNQQETEATSFDFNAMRQSRPRR